MTEVIQILQNVTSKLIVDFNTLFCQIRKMQLAAVVTISEPAQIQNNLSQCFETEVQKPTDMLVAATCISF